MANLTRLPRSWGLRLGQLDDVRRVAIVSFNDQTIARDLDFGREFLIRNADQLLFGTDVLMPEQKIPQFELLDSLKLPEEVQYKIFRGNAIKLLKLEGK